MEMHARISRSSKGRNIEHDEWINACLGFKEINITDVLIQQNPFTQEFVEFESAGSGYWLPRTGDAPKWPGDGKVVFRKDEYGVTFVQYRNIKNQVLVAIANLLDAELYLSEV